MAQPRVFVSSTYYDLKYVRSSLELFIDSLGYEAVLSERGDIAYAPDEPLDESCYREVEGCDIYVLIVGGRYGSEASASRDTPRPDVADRYESVTKLEYKAAVTKGIPIYVLVERSVFAEYQTFQRNRENGSIRYAHVDNVNVFGFLDEILAQPRNNPLQTFDRYVEIEAWLRSQWSGLFRELLYRLSSQQQIATLAGQVAELGEANKTLKRYLEEVVGKVLPGEASSIIASEQRRLDEATLEQRLKRNGLVEYLIDREFMFPVLRNAIMAASNLQEFRDMLDKSREDDPAYVRPAVLGPPIWPAVLVDLNDAREIVGRPLFAEE